MQIVPTTTSLNAEGLAKLFFREWYCENGLPLEIVSDCDKLFLSRFWRTLHRLTGIKLKMSSSYHPQTDGASERTNKTVIQCIRFAVERDQKGWANALPKVRFSVTSQRLVLLDLSVFGYLAFDYLFLAARARRL
jgi:transposase InsO family protein